MKTGDFLANYVCAAYKNSGLVAFKEGMLFVLLGWQFAEKDKAPSHGRTIHLETVPPIPSDAEVVELVSSESGQYISIVTNCGVFIVIVDKSIWQYLNMFSARYVIERLQVHYYVKCHAVSPLMFSGENALSVVKQRWLVTDTKTHILCILSEDNFLRFYEMQRYGEQDFKVATLRIDFNNMTVYNSSMREASHFKSFGLQRNIVSFDFGPPVYQSDDEHFISVFAMDSDGDIYYAVFSIRDYSCIGPVGPLLLNVNRQSSKVLGCDGVDLKLVQHAHSAIFSVFAVASSKGSVYHIVLTQSHEQHFSEQEFVYGSYFEGFVGELVYQLDVSANNQTIMFYQDTTLPSMYFIRCDHGIASVDISNWINDIYVGKSSEKHGSRRLAGPSFLQIAVLVPDELRKNHFVSFALVSLIPQMQGKDEQDETGIRRYSLIARTLTGKVFTKIWTVVSVINNKHEASTSTVCRTPRATYPALLSSITIDKDVTAFKEVTVPFVIFDDIPEEQKVEVFSLLSSLFQKASAAMNKSLDAFEKSSSNIINEIESVEAAKNCVATELSEHFEDIRELDHTATKTRKRIAERHKHFLKIFEAVGRKAIDQPLTPAEQQMHASLKEYRRRLGLINDVLPSLRHQLQYVKSSCNNIMTDETPFGMAIVRNLQTNNRVRSGVGSLMRRTEKLMKELDQLRDNKRGGKCDESIC